MTDKVVKLVTSRDNKQQALLSLGVQVDVKYTDDEVTLVRMQMSIGGKQEAPQHILIEHNKE